MPLRQADLLRLCEILAEQEELKVTTNESFKGACCAFAGAVVGGILGGPVGLAVGGSAGSVIAAYKSKDKFKSVVQIINEMPNSEKNRLTEAVQDVVRSIDASDVVTLMAIMNANHVLRDSVLDVIKSSITSNMGLTLA